jgi:hypothetical protein
VISLSSLSTEYIRVPVAATVNNAPYNPTNDAVAFAFTGGANPAGGDWHSGSWDSANTPYAAQCLVGPGAGGVALTVGTWVIWIKITDNPEVPVRAVGQLSVT